jgi:hypothetical protein
VDNSNNTNPVPEEPVSEYIENTNTPSASDAIPDTKAIADKVRLEQSTGMPKRKKLLIFGGVALVVAVALATFFLFPGGLKPDSTSKTTQPTAKEFGVAVGLSEGLVQYSSDIKTWKDLITETNLKEGDSIRTASDGRVVLLIDDGSAVRLDKSSEAKLTSLDTTSITITNTSGALYNRVVPSDTRVYKVAVGNETYKAKGTAYRTFNQADKKGVEVFHSTVEAVTSKKDVPEGSGLYSKHAQVDRQGAVLALDVESIKVDNFLKWNSDQDKKVAEYADKLGILTEIDKPAPAPAPAPKPATTTTSGISLSGSKSDYSAVFSWKASGVDTSKGFKLVRSSKTTTPTYPDNTVSYIEAGKTSFTLYVGDDTKYNYRLCAYRDGGCVAYSNTVAVTTLKKVKEAVVAGAVSLSNIGSSFNWSIQGTAPYGYKIVIGTSSGPTYQNNFKKLFTESTSYDLSSTDLTAGTPYYVKVCKYNDGNCTDYSNEIVYTP